ncbi:MAG: VWA domain-containing protein [Gammaproteobacteria bacterium]|jgi:Ca-activated chloride channel family protein|nr:VWA domain-containing protein [Gammaproteobacteria bacterium]
MRFPTLAIRWPLALGLAVLIAACARTPEPQPPQPLEPEITSRRDAPVARSEVNSQAQRPAAVAELVAGPAMAFGAARKSMPLDDLRSPSAPVDRESYARVADNPVRRAALDPLSTFSVDVDTGAYANVRRLLNEGRLPPADAVRIEELINYFDYGYQPPRDRKQPFSVVTELAPSPWNPELKLLQIGLKGYEVERAERPAANLVFLVDVSGSMRAANKLPLLKSGLRLLVNQLEARDRVALVVYAGGTGTALESTPGDQRGRIHAALEQLRAGGRTHGAAGIRLAYQLARDGFREGGINRVILATDGDFNVGLTGVAALKDLVALQRKRGIELTTLGFGSGNYNDQLMEQLADVGNGNYAYIDTLNEARKVLVEELASTLVTIARDVKVQVEFNPAVVAEYRLVGYSNRLLRDEDFRNDKVDAGDIGAGHTVTALYEIALAGGRGDRLPSLRYGARTAAGAPEGSPELAFVKLRYKQPGGQHSALIETAIRPESERTITATSDSFRFAAAVAAFGQLLRGGEYAGSFDYPDVVRLAGPARGADPHGYRGEFLRLVELAQTLAAG